MAQGSEHQLLGRKRKKETKTQRVVILVNACGQIVSKREA